MRWLILALFIFINGCDNAPEFNPVNLVDGKFMLNKSSLENNNPIFYVVQIDKKKITFFVLKTANKVYSFFNICATCRAYQLGYKAQKDYIVCKSCQMEVQYEELPVGVGGCYPYRLEGYEEGEFYIIKESDMAVGKKYFF
ncbi:MAG: Fe-S-containing protein [Candidatus Magnetoovum sp. WYHC-5]|nr:Fe-S-containing protein [Candidatus Magnetoovum sp. WYHC-5]